MYNKNYITVTAAKLLQLWSLSYKVNILGLFLWLLREKNSASGRKLALGYNKGNDIVRHRE